MGFCIGILIESSPPKGGGTQVDDFTDGFTKGIIDKILRRRNGEGQGDPDPLVFSLRFGEGFGEFFLFLEDIWGYFWEVLESMFKNC